MKPILFLVAHLVLRIFMLLIRFTCGIRLLHEDPLDTRPVHDRGPKGRIYAFWHSHLLMATWSFRNRGVYAVVSRSQDGEYLARLIAGWGYKLIRGSSSRGWITVYRQALQVLRQGEIVGITPDGPRGPAQAVNPGTVRLAMASGAEIIPVGVGYTDRKRLGSWDRFSVPRPFSRIVILFGRPYTLDPDLDDAGIRLAEQELERKLNAIVAMAQGLSQNS
jgi:lysophospholipid acyltransferase (LPLAT)-like uncharacterized protein